ncbi:unnamed protein product [Amoebophrya sp. A25]|nr:unnamed protein product [Amoebophrya sp. A25]|eukprot:GSA25T00021924001.1
MSSAALMMGGGGLLYMMWSSGSIMPLIYCFLGLFVLLVGQLIINQEKIVYVPEPMPGMIRPEDNPEGFRSPGEHALKYEDVYMKTTDGITIHAWWMPAGASGATAARNAPTILFCHANAGNIGMRLPNFADLVRKTGCNVLAFDYRGFGKSEGSPTEAGLIQDGLVCLKTLREKFDIAETFLFGRSLGGAVAVGLVKCVEEFAPEQRAQYPKIKGVMLENTFTSISDLADKIFPFLSYLGWVKAKFLRIKWDTESKIQTLSKTSGTKFLFLVGEKDELVPPAHSKRLHEKCPCTSKIVTFKDGMHNDTYHKGGKEYQQVVQDFVRS